MGLDQSWWKRKVWISQTFATVDLESLLIWRFGRIFTTDSHGHFAGHPPGKLLSTHLGSCLGWLWVRSLLVSELSKVKVELNFRTLWFWPKALKPYCLCWWFFCEQLLTWNPSWKSRTSKASCWTPSMPKGICNNSLQGNQMEGKQLWETRNQAKICVYWVPAHNNWAKSPHVAENPNLLVEASPPPNTTFPSSGLFVGLKQASCRGCHFSHMFRETSTPPKLFTRDPV